MSRLPHITTARGALRCRTLEQVDFVDWLKNLADPASWRDCPATLAPIPVAATDGIRRPHTAQAPCPRR